jgi:homoserine kinase type II
MNDVNGLVAAWGMGPPVEVRTPETGTINRTVLIATREARYALRGYRHTVRAPVEREHALIAYARSHGVPAVAPLPTLAGETILERDGRYYALFPWAPGRQLAHADLGAAEIATMGTFLAELHRALRDSPRHLVAVRELRSNRDAALAELRRYEALVASLPQRTESDERILARLVGQRAWLEASWTEPEQSLAQLPRQPIHGDYTEANLFFAGGRVAAVIDWDQAYLAPPAWEVARTLDLVFRFAPEPCRLFLGGYRSVGPLSDGELDLAVEHYSAMRACDCWMYAAIYEQGNDRVRQFIEPGGFTPLEAKWRAFRRSAG